MDKDINISINTAIDIFKNNLTNLIGNSQLPVGIMYYILKDITYEIQEVYNNSVEKERQKINEIVSKNETTTEENSNIESNNVESNEN